MGISQQSSQDAIDSNGPVSCQRVLKRNVFYIVAVISPENTDLIFLVSLF